MAISLKEFCEVYDLDLRYSVRTSFDDITCSVYQGEIQSGPFLVGEYGSGKTVVAARNSYAKTISGETLVVGAMTVNRREILVPELELESE